MTDALAPVSTNTCSARVVAVPIAESAAMGQGHYVYNASLASDPSLPRTYGKAKAGPDREKWAVAVAKEIEVLQAEFQLRTRRDQLRKVNTARWWENYCWQSKTNLPTLPSNAVQELSAHLSNPGKDHWNAVGRVVCFLAGNTDQVLKMRVRKTYMWSGMSTAIGRLTRKTKVQLVFWLPLEVVWWVGSRKRSRWSR